MANSWNRLSILLGRVRPKFALLFCFLIFQQSQFLLWFGVIMCYRWCSRVLVWFVPILCLEINYMLTLFPVGIFSLWMSMLWWCGIKSLLWPGSYFDYYLCSFVPLQMKFVVQFRVQSSFQVLKGKLILTYHVLLYKY